MDLPQLLAGDVDIAVSHSSLGRTDALTASGEPSPAVRPIVPGCTFAGTVLASRHLRWHEGDTVVATGHGLGLGHPGGWAERARLPGDWLMTIPDGLSAAETVAIGTPGLAAMLAVTAIEDQGVPPESGPLLVNGATGGVGSLTIIALAALGYEVVAATRRPELADYLRSLGARTSTTSPFVDFGRSGPGAWAGAVDTLGGPDFADLVARIRPHGVVVSLGTIRGELAELPLLQLTSGSIAVLGIDARQSGPARVADAWARWGEALNDGSMRERLARMVSVITLDEAVFESQALLAGERRGRILIRVGAAERPRTRKRNGQTH